MVGAPDGVGFWVVVGVTAVDVDVLGAVIVNGIVVCFGVFCFSQTIWLERGPETVGVHRVDAAGAGEVDAVG